MSMDRKPATDRDIWLGLCAGLAIVVPIWALILLAWRFVS